MGQSYEVLGTTNGPLLEGTARCASARGDSDTAQSAGTHKDMLSAMQGGGRFTLRSATHYITTASRFPFCFVIHGVTCSHVHPTGDGVDG
jgi:hypothetical protein